MGNALRRRVRGAAVLTLAPILAGCSALSSLHQSPSSTPLPQPSWSSPAEPTLSPSPTPKPEPAFDRERFSVDHPASLWVIVNKRRPLNPADYRAPDLIDVPVSYAHPPTLRREAADAVVALFQAAEKAGLELVSQSAYRSYSTQVSVYNGLVDQRGRARADRTSARPGHSEHQTGLAIDIASLPAECTLERCFGETPHGQWLARNAWRFGFVLRYPEGATPITGYEYEPWHFRYVGKALAAQMHEQDVATLEQFFGLPPAPDYPD